jgi:hypothetical protein
VFFGVPLDHSRAEGDERTEDAQPAEQWAPLGGRRSRRFSLDRPRGARDDALPTCDKGIFSPRIALGKRCVARPGCGSQRSYLLPVGAVLMCPWAEGAPNEGVAEEQPCRRLYAVETSEARSR